MPSDSGGAPSTLADKRTPREFEFREELARITGGANSSRIGDGDGNPPRIDPSVGFDRDSLASAIRRQPSPRKVKLAVRKVKALARASHRSSS
jgi:hypothetical protein